MRQIEPIAQIKTDFPTKFGIPRQSGLVEELKGMIIFAPKYRRQEALRGLEGFSHIWLIWGFLQEEGKDWSPTVRPPRLGGNKRMGVFATRAPFRPNGLGLSCVRLESLRKDHPEYGPVLYVLGADLMDQTPIYDIKPYIPHSDCQPGAEGGFSTSLTGDLLQVQIPQEWENCIPEEKRAVLKKILAQDPRPSYQQNSSRIYGFSFAGMEIKFKVQSGILTVCAVELQKNA